MKSPFFSVIIPTLNEEKYLPTLLKSLVKQTFQDFEVIVVDGRSNDKTAAVFSGFKSQLPSAQMILSDKRNVGYQRNLGAKKASGEYLAFLDADVDVSETFLEEIHIGAIKKKFQLATTWIIPDSDKPIDQLMLMVGNLGQEFAKVIDKSYAGGYNTIVKKKFFTRMNGFREDIQIGEDHDFSMRANRIGVKPVIFKEPHVVWSMRRFRSEGKLKIANRLIQSGVYQTIKGPITKGWFDYPMGGHVHGKKLKTQSSLRLRSGQAKLKIYIKKLNKLHKQIMQLLKE